MSRSVQIFRGFTIAHSHYGCRWLIKDFVFYSIWDQTRTIYSCFPGILHGLSIAVNPYKIPVDHFKKQLYLLTSIYTSLQTNLLTCKLAAKLKCDYIKSISLQIIMLPVDFAGDSTLLITFREHADSSDMTLLNARHNITNATWYITHPRFFLWWNAKVTTIDQLCSWFIFSLSNHRSCAPSIRQRSINDQREIGTIHTAVIYHGKQDVLLFYSPICSLKQL